MSSEEVKLSSESAGEKRLSPPPVIHEKSGSSRELFVLAYPLMISFMSFSIMGIIDTLVVGYVGTPQQGGVGMGMNLSWMMFSLFTGTMSAISIFVAQSYGAGKIDQLARWSLAAFAIAIPGSLVVYCLIPLVPKLVPLIGTKPEVVEHVVIYMQVSMIGIPFLLANFIFSGFLRGLGDTFTPMIVTVIANVINVLLDIVLVFGMWGFPRLEVKGAALASLIATALSAFMYLYVYLNKKNNELYHTRNFSLPSLNEVGRFLKIGAPMGGAWSIEMVSWAFMMSFISTISSAGLAATSIIWQLLHFSFMPTVALSIAVSTLVGQYLGAERVDLAQRSAKIGMIWGIVLMAFIGLVYALGRGHIIALFNPDPEVIEIGGTLLLIAAAFQIFDAIGITSSGVLRGAGDTRFPLYAQIALAWLIFIPLVYVFGKILDWQVYGAWLAALVFITLLGLTLAARYASGKWKSMRVV